MGIMLPIYGQSDTRHSGVIYKFASFNHVFATV